LSEAIFLQRTPHSHAVEVSASKAAWLQPGCPLGRGPGTRRFPDYPSLLWETIFASGPNQATNHCAGVGSLASLPKKAP